MLFSRSFLLLDRATHPHCSVCSKPWNDCVDYYCLGLRFRDWFVTTEQCDKLLSHWEQRNEWLNKFGEAEEHARTELWHGKRFQELSWFWDPESEFILPEKCPLCSRVVPSRTVSESLSSRCAVGSRIEINCPTCKDNFVTYARTARGDPRNQAIVIHEDGWCPFSTSSKNSIAAITVTNACMTKVDRADAKNAGVTHLFP